MPMVYEVDLARGVVITTARGVVTAEELRAHVRGLASDPHLPRPMRELFDGRAIERFGLSGTDIQQLVTAAAAIENGLGGGQLAIVAPQDVVFGLARMAEILSESTTLTIRAFRDIEPAQRWIFG